MAQRIKLRNSVVKGQKPAPADIAIGEVCVGAHPETPGLLFKDSDGNLIEVEPNKVDSVNTKTGDVVLDAADVTAIPDGDWSGYADAVDVEDDDLFILNRAGTTLTVKGSEIGGGGSKPIDPDAGDISGPTSGTGTEVDPFILTSGEVNYGESAVTVETIAISNQKAGNLVGFEDVNAETNGARFTQSTGVVGSDGTWTGKLTFTDTPASSSPDTFTGKLQLADTEIYFQWAVAVKANATIAKPSIIAPPDGAGIGGDVTYTPRTSAVTSAVSTGGWTSSPITQYPSQTYKDVAYNNGRFVAVGAQVQAGDIIYSDNGGATWTAATKSTSAQGVNEVHYVDNKFVALSHNAGNTWTSIDGKSWSGPFYTGVAAYGLAFGNGLWVVVARSSPGSERVATSPDGQTWTLRSSATDDKRLERGLCFANGVFVAFPDIIGDPYYTSENGINWVERTLPSGAGTPVNVWSANNKIFSFSYEGGVYVSEDGVTWTIGSNDTSVQSYSYTGQDAYFNGLYIVGSEDKNKVQTSPDGLNWTALTMEDFNGTEDYYTNFASDGSVVIAGSYYTNTISTSDTGGAKGTALTLTDSNSYNNADGADMGQPISETFTAGQTVKAESTVVYADTPAFSTTLYTGSSAARNLVTGVDNTGKSMIWLANRDVANKNALYDTFRDGAIQTDGENGTSPSVNEVSAWLSNGVSLVGSSDPGYGGWSNYLGESNVAWNFRAAPGFFDVVTYDANNIEQTIPHSLGSRPGFMLLKRIDATGGWTAIHTPLYDSDNKGLVFNNASAAFPDATNLVKSVDANNFVLASYSASGTPNDANSKYVAYLFGDTPGLIKCGTFTSASNGSANVTGVGFKPGWLLVKQTSSATAGYGDWMIWDDVRGNNPRLFANDNQAETTNRGWTPQADGFQLDNGTMDNNQEVMFVAIAKDAVAPPVAATGTVADVVNNILTLTDVGGTWSAGDFAVNDTEATKTGPGADVLEFVGSIPSDVPADSVSDWGDAVWQVADNVNFTGLMEGTKLITNDTIQQTLSESERGSIVLAADTQYWARLRYKATSPDVQSPYSSAVTFKTAAAGVPVVDDVFATTVYTGDEQPSRVIANGIDNTGKFLLWTKSRTTGESNMITDGEIFSDVLKSNLTAQAVPSGNSGYLDVLNNGYELGNAGEYNYRADYVSWNFKAAPGFYDVVKFTGNAVNGDSSAKQTINHSLQSAPGFIVVKGLGYTSNWICYHKTLGNDSALKFNLSDKADIGGKPSWGQTDPTDSTFTVGPYGYGVNDTGADYIAYLFGDTPGLIKCGVFETRSNGTQDVVTGFEPQWLLIKSIEETGGWRMYDTKRGMPGAGATPELFADENSQEYSGSDTKANSDGFSFSHNANKNYIYIAIAAGTDTTFFDPESFNALNEHQVERRFGIEANKVPTYKLPITRLTNEPKGVTAAFVPEGDKYRPIEDQTGTVNRLNSEVSEAQARVAEAEQRMSDFEAAWLTRIEALEAKGDEPGTTDEKPKRGKKS